MSKTISVANTCLMDSAGNILILERSDDLGTAGLWGFPGGMVDDGEDSQEAALRELREETGILPGDFNVITSQKFLITKPVENIEIIVYLAKVSIDVKITLDPLEHTDHNWINVSDLILRKDIMPGIPTMLKELLKLENLIDHTIIKPSKIQLIPVSPL